MRLFLIPIQSELLLKSLDYRDEFFWFYDNWILTKIMTIPTFILDLHLKAYDEAFAPAESMFNENWISEEICTFLAIQENRIFVDQKLWISELECLTEEERHQIVSQFQGPRDLPNENAIDSILEPILNTKNYGLFKKPLLKLTLPKVTQFKWTPKPKFWPTQIKETLVPLGNEKKPWRNPARGTNEWQAQPMNPCVKYNNAPKLTVWTMGGTENIKETSGTRQRHKFFDK